MPETYEHNHYENIDGTFYPSCCDLSYEEMTEEEWEALYQEQLYESKGG